MAHDRYRSHLIHTIVCRSHLIHTMRMPGCSHLCTHDRCRFISFGTCTRFDTVHMSNTHDRYRVLHLYTRTWSCTVVTLFTNVPVACHITSPGDSRSHVHNCGDVRSHVHTTTCTYLCCVAQCSEWCTRVIVLSYMFRLYCNYVADVPDVQVTCTCICVVVGSDQFRFVYCGGRMFRLVYVHVLCVVVLHSDYIRTCTCGWSNDSQMFQFVYILLVGVRVCVRNCGAWSD